MKPDDDNRILLRDIQECLGTSLKKRIPYVVTLSMTPWANSNVPYMS